METRAGQKGQQPSPGTEKMSNQTSSGHEDPFSCSCISWGKKWKIFDWSRWYCSKKMALLKKRGWWIRGANPWTPIPVVKKENNNEVDVERESKQTTSLIRYLPDAITLCHVKVQYVRITTASNRELVSTLLPLILS
jgi:hypothetical protein